MLNNMLSYATALLGAIAQFLSSEPMIYIVSLLALCIVLRFFLRIMGKS